MDSSRRAPIHVPALASAAAILGICCFVASCGGSGPQATTSGATGTSSPTPVPTATPNEDALASSLLLTVNDFPVGWAEQASSNSPSPLDKCQSNAAGKTGRAKSGDFSSGGSASVSETVAVFDNSPDVSTALDQAAAIGDCVTKAVTNGELDTDAAAYSAASFSPLSFTNYGDRSVAYRFKFHATAKGQSGLGSQGDVYLDAVYIIHGRVGVSLSASDVLSPFDTTQLQQIATKALAKVVSTCSNCPPQ
jgi:hypothetical protein